MKIENVHVDTKYMDTMSNMFAVWTYMYVHKVSTETSQNGFRVKVFLKLLN